MRNPKRIRRFCNELADLWESKCPDLRFGQIMAYVSSKCGDPFYTEDEELMNQLKKIFERGTI